MRSFVGASTLMVVTALIILCHCAIISKNVREYEVHSGLESAMDRALDEMQDYYSDLRYNEDGTFDGITEEEIVSDCIEVFCNSLNEGIFTDGDFEVYVIEANVLQGKFDIVVKQSYSYKFMGLKGKTLSERAFELE